MFGDGGNGMAKTGKYGQIIQRFAGDYRAVHIGNQDLFAAPVGGNDIDVQLLVGGAAAQYLKVLVMSQILCLKTVVKLSKQFSRMAVMKPR